MTTSNIATAINSATIAPKTSVIRPGILVSLKTELRGGAQYIAEELGHERDGAQDVAEWKTKRIISDVEEYDRAKKARTEARGKILPLCIPTAFGLICPTARAEELEQAIREAREVCEDFNESSSYTQVRVYVLRGTIASSDEEATKAVADEVANLLAQMEAGVRGGDVETVRKAALKAKQIGQVLDEAQGKKVAAAVEAARKAAREIVRRVEKDGEDVAKVIREQNMAAVEMARFSFLDIAEAGEKQSERKAAPQRQLDTTVSATKVTKEKRNVQLELEPAPVVKTRKRAS